MGRKVLLFSFQFGLPCIRGFMYNAYHFIYKLYDLTDVIFEYFMNSI